MLCSLHMSNNIGRVLDRKGSKLVGLFFLVLGVVVGAVHVYLDKQPRTRARVAQIFLLWLLVITVGIQGVFAFIGHTVFADATAASIGWPAGNQIGRASCRERV